MLKIENAGPIGYIETGVLDTLNKTLKEFSLEQSYKINCEIFIEGLTGSQNLDKIEMVKFWYKLETSITSTSFVGTSNAKVLDLSDCQIETVEADAFDPMTSLEILKLQDNLIKTIPDGFFNVILTRNIPLILLEGNRWECDCGLMPFKMSFIEHTNFVGQLECYTPDKFKSHKIIEANFCNSYIPPTTTSIASYISTYSSTYSPEQVCKTEISKVVFIESPKQSMEIFEIENGKVILQVDELKDNSFLIWFSLNDQMPYVNASNDISCLVGSGTSFQINNLLQNAVYTFCLIEPMKMTVSPLDCISYTRKRDSNVVLPWLSDNKKSLIFGIISISSARF